jgi:hypothetical protein
MIKMKFNKLKEFIVRTGASKSKIRRFYNNHTDLYAETKMKGIWRMYPIEHERYFDSEVMFEENKALRQENKAMKNLIECLGQKNSLEYTLWGMEWSFFITVAYRNERNQKSCYKQMSGLYYQLIEKYGDKTTINIFFTTEPFVDRKGYHNHFLLYVENAAFHKLVTQDIMDYFSYDRIDFNVYDKLKAGVWYIAKGGLDGEDYDIMGNNLPSNIRKSA